MTNNDIRAFGAIPSPKDLRDYKGVCAVNAKTFPEAFELKMPPVKNQGSVGSCVAHAIATSIEYFNSVQGDTSDEISVGFIYGNRAESDWNDAGMIVAEALNRVTKCGSVRSKLFNKHTEVPQIQEAVKSKIMELLPEAYPNRFTSYFRLYGDNPIKASLMENGPVIFAMNWFSDIEVVDGIITTNYVLSDVAHAMVIYGWNDKGWLIQNSWGTNWGNGGRAILPYSVPRIETWGITDTFSENLRNMRLAEIDRQLNDLVGIMAEKDARIEELKEELEKINNAESEKLVAEYDELLKECTKYEEQIEEYRKEIELLEKQLIQIKKPFNSSIAQLVARFFNLIINMFVRK